MRRWRGPTPEVARCPTDDPASVSTGSGLLGPGGAVVRAGGYGVVLAVRGHGVVSSVT